MSWVFVVQPMEMAIQMGIHRSRTPCELRLEIVPGYEPDCAPHPFDIMAVFALYQAGFGTS